MPRYIDADTIPWEGFPNDCGEYHEDYVEKRVVDKMPTIEARPMVRGEWVKPYINFYGHPCHCCSVCGFKASWQDKNFCPNCGADMRGDGDAKSSD